VRVNSHPAGLQLPKKAVGLLAYLAARPGQPASRDKLADLLWGNGAPDQARHSLRQALLALRSLLAEVSPTLLLVEGETLALDAARVDVDVAAFERLAGEGSYRSLERAVALYRGDFLEGFRIIEPAFEEWVVGERERLRELAVEALARLLQHQCRSSAVESAIQTALRLLRLDRTQEVVHRTLIRLYARQGRRGEALRQYRACVAALRGGLGVEPEPETVRLFRDLLQPCLAARAGALERLNPPAAQAAGSPHGRPLPGQTSPG
jgi:DNA-binding SARP family transcriptional activator